MASPNSTAPDQQLRNLMQAVQSGPADARLHHALGKAFYARRRPLEALRSFDEALRLRPNLIESLNDRGLALQALGREEEAIASYSAAIRLRPNFPEAHYNRANVLAGRRQFDAAAADYRQAIACGLRRAEVYNNLGLALQETGRMEEGLESLRSALAANPMFAEAWYNLAYALGRLARSDEALAGYERALACRPDYAQAHAGRGQLLMELNRPAEALANLERAMRLGADRPWLRGGWLYARLNLCEWADLGSEVRQLAREVQAGRQATPPLLSIYMLDSPLLQLRAAQTWAAAHVEPDAAVAATRVSVPHGARVRLGYFSADFRTHPVAMLTAGMFEHHDRGRFELFAISFGPEGEDALRTRLRSSFDHFLDVGSRSDAEIAELSRSLGIDIAVDLQGFTTHQRTGIFGRRAAPVQVSYLGYPATLGTMYMDYLIADRIVVPEEHRVHYAEKIVYLPHCFQVNDRTRAIADRVFSPDELDLPQEAFVFCCFNHVYKIQPEVFACWMRVLRQVPGSVLWLAQMSDRAAANLRAEAQRSGIDPARLVFATKMPRIEDHLARYRAADLFLDTLPYNAHATASDALWAGLPVLTVIGQSFAARVGASLLHTLGLDELIAPSLPDYEQLALAMARDRIGLKSIRAKLAEVRLTAPLFDTAAFTRHMETAYRAMLERSREGLPPEHLDVGAMTSAQHTVPAQQTTSAPE